MNASQSLYRSLVIPTPHWVEVTKVGNLIMVEWVLKYVLFQEISKILLTYAKNLNQKFKLYVWKCCGISFIAEKCVSWAY